MAVYRWTKSKPPLPGYYWAVSTGALSGLQYNTIVKVYASERGGPVDTVFYDGKNFPIDAPNFRAWSDKPIEEPLLMLVDDVVGA